MSREGDWTATMEERLLDAALPAATRLGWTRRLVDFCGAACGLSPGETRLLLPHGARDLAALLARRHDARALQRLAGRDVESLKIREKIRLAVAARCDAAMEDEAAVRRWSGFLALPRNVPLALRLLWASADRLWRWAGDTATDENHYTKRLLLAEILASSLAVRLAQGEAKAERHIDARIAAVMAFERWKAGVRKPDRPERIAGALARLRYRGARAAVSRAAGSGD